MGSRPGRIIQNTIIKKYTNCLPAWLSGRKGRSLAVQPDCLKGRVVYATVYWDMHFNDLLGSMARVGYGVPVPDFYLQWNPSCEATPFASEKWPFKRGGLSSGVEIYTFMFRFTLSSGLSRGGGLSSRWPLKRGSTVVLHGLRCRKAL